MEPARTLLYCAAPPVDALNTLGLLESPFHAIWFPPDCRHLKPAAGERVWVLWRSDLQAAPTLLGTGRLRATRTGELLWTNRSAPGIRDLARQFGYRGPSNMAFLRLEETRIAPANIALPGLGAAPVGISEAAPAQRDVLEAAFRVDERRANRLQAT
jgi:hypothetical protein